MASLLGKIRKRKGSLGFGVNYDCRFNRTKKEFYINQKITHFTNDYIEIFDFGEDEDSFRSVGTSKEIERFRGTGSGIC